MSQTDIMEFLDKHIGNFYSAKEIEKALKKKIGLTSIHGNLRRILKREEYIAKISQSKKKGGLQTHYGRA